jgi:hypothetical protein
MFCKGVQYLTQGTDAQTHLQIAAMLRISGVIKPVHPFAFMSCKLALLPSPVVDIRVLTSVWNLFFEIHREEGERRSRRQDYRLGTAVRVLLDYILVADMHLQTEHARHGSMWAFRSLSVWECWVWGLLEDGSALVLPPRHRALQVLHVAFICFLLILLLLLRERERESSLFLKPR